MLGKRQIETLQRFAGYLDNGEPKKLVVTIHPFRHFTREAGGGSGHRITIHLEYVSDNSVDLKAYLSTCQETFTAVNKGIELARYLRDTLGVEEAFIRLQSRM